MGRRHFTLYTHRRNYKAPSLQARGEEWRWSLHNLYSIPNQPGDHRRLLIALINASDFVYLSHSPCLNRLSLVIVGPITSSPEGRRKADKQYWTLRLGNPLKGLL
jgi:hypothetical protein